MPLECQNDEMISSESFYKLERSPFPALINWLNSWLILRILEIFKNWKIFLRNFSENLSLKIQLNTSFLIVVQIQPISFSKSMSKKVGSEIERLWNWISRSIQSRLKIASLKFRVVLCRIRPFPTLISKIKWCGSEVQTLNDP